MCLYITLIDFASVCRILKLPKTISFAKQFIKEIFEAKWILKCKHNIERWSDEQIYEYIANNMAGNPFQTIF